MKFDEQHAGAFRASEVAKYPPEGKQSAVLACLAIVQHEQGHVSAEAENAVADYLGMAPIAVHEITTFYNMYNQQPVGSSSSMSAPTCRASCATAKRRWSMSAGAWVSKPTAAPTMACSPCSPANAWAPAPMRR